MSGELTKTVRSAFEVLSRTLDEYRPVLQPMEVGRVTHVTPAIVRLTGLPSVQAGEIVRFPERVLGVASDLERDGVGVILLGESDRLRAGDEVRRTGRVIDVPVGRELVGRVLNALGEPIDDRGPLGSHQRLPIEREAPAILDRAPVSEPLQTGIKAIDALVPIGRGQRELILGDRQTGKTAIAVDTILNQRDTGVLSVYCAIGQRTSAVAQVIADLRAHGTMERCVVLVAGGDDPPGLQYIAPYAATTIGEYFMEQGRDVLLVYDDLTRHARAYRELSLLLRRPPGREAYPGDIFYIHSRLLERSTHLRDGGSLTALPIVETQAQNLSAYIPTNLISITDGQVYLSPVFFQKGNLPAVDVGRSVSRVGGKAQLAAYRAMAGALRLSYEQFEELETFSRFGTRLDEATRRNLERGRRVREVLKQPQSSPLGVPEQIVVLLAAAEGVLDHLELVKVRAAERAICSAVRDETPEICERIEGGRELLPEDRARLLETARSALSAAGLAKE